MFNILKRIFDSKGTKLLNLSGFREEEISDRGNLINFDLEFTDSQRKEEQDILSLFRSCYHKS